MNSETLKTTSQGLYRLVCYRDGKPWKKLTTLVA